MGADVRVLTRDRSKAQALNDAGVEVIVGNLENLWAVMWGDGTHAVISSRGYQIYSFIPTVAKSPRTSHCEIRAYSDGLHMNRLWVDRFDRVLGAVIFGGKFLGEAFLIFGILTGLATIIWNLSRQARNLPELARRALDDDNPNRGTPMAGPVVPSALLKLGVLGFVVLAMAFPLALYAQALSGCHWVDISRAEPVRPHYGWKAY